MKVGVNFNGQKVYSSARDIGNIVAGYVAAVNGLPWQLARLGFDAYQSYTAYKDYKSGKSTNKNYIQMEGISTRNAEYYGYRLGCLYNRPQEKLSNLWDSIISFFHH